ncbi:MAG TPA: putative capsular polysaccharide synthesis family protein [Gemmatimonadales bacterium]|nr:putative capsular polysaccharide synthesis family protein [Gemmatimonadales bacterium]
MGSVAVTRAIRRHLPRADVYHTHYLHPRTIAEHRERFTRAHRETGRAGLPREYLGAKMLDRRLRRGAGEAWRVVTLVRDPVARTVSAFFRLFTYNHPELGPAFHADPANAERLVELFLDPGEPEHEFTLGWWDTEMRDVFGIDVFKSPFSPAAGAARYGGERCRVLLLRLEDLDRIGAAELSRFLDAPGLTLAAENRTEQEPYFPAYSRFLELLELPAAYLDRMYGSRLARHFYTEDELARFRARWER